jgi:hypothetical protein
VIKSTKRFRLPDGKSNRKRVKTFIARYGRQGYQNAGKLGGEISPTRFTSETARQAGLRSQAKRREQRLAAEQEHHDTGLKPDQTR